MEKEKLIEELICILDKKYGLHNITENDNLFEIKSYFTEMHMVYFVLDIIKKYNLHFSESDFQDYQFTTISNIADKILIAYNFH